MQTKQSKLFMLLVGAKPPGRHTEQHDIFFGIGASIRDLIPQVQAFWPEAKKNLHLDAWREVTHVNGYHISVKEHPSTTKSMQLFFINLGGYKPNEFEEFHYKMLIAAENKNAAIIQAKQTAFFKHTGFAQAKAHIDDKYGVDVDDMYAVTDILPQWLKYQYCLEIQPAQDHQEDTIHLGYFKLDQVEKWAPEENIG